jgi:tetratricopeptide (TPR) repeat protein
LALFIRLWLNPSAAMSAILDRGSLLIATIAALAATALVNFRLPVGFFMPPLVLAAIYVPGILILGALIARLGSPGMVLRRDYSAMLTCSAMAMAAAGVPLAGLLYFLKPVPAIAAAGIYFVVLMFFAIRTVLGVENGLAVAVVSLSWIPLVLAAIFWGPLSMVLHFLASPFILFYLWYYMGSEVSGLGDALRRQQNFRRMLEAAAVNPHDGEAQYQLGLIHQQRRQYSEAIQRFRKAIEIDPTLTDAHFQLGRIAREQGRPREALTYFQTVVDQDERHNSSEVLRELGAIYVGARQFKDAKNELETYVERRPYDPEGLYWYGQALEGLGGRAEAVELYGRAIEADRTAPRHRKRFTARWSRLAQRALGKVQAPPHKDSAAG